MEVFAAPEEIVKPKFDVKDIPAYKKAVTEYENQIIDFCKQYGKGKYAGSMVKFQVADGYAVYIVFSLKPLELIHVDTWDEYQFPHIKRLNTNDIIKNIEQQKALSKLFS